MFIVHDYMYVHYTHPDTHKDKIATLLNHTKLNEFFVRILHSITLHFCQRQILDSTVYTDVTVPTAQTECLTSTILQFEASNIFGLDILATRSEWQKLETQYRRLSVDDF